jgi:hypothetical protein
MAAFCLPVAYRMQEAAAKSCEISLESVCRELDDAVATARARGQAQPLVNAASLRARLGGLLVERHEIGAPGDFNDCRTEAEIAADLLSALAGDEPVGFTDEDRAKAADIFAGATTKLMELVASCAAKQINATVTARQKLIRNNGRRFA